MNELSTQSANWRYHCFVTCATQQWMDEFSCERFIHCYATNVAQQ